jgi:hypothetical protein
MMQPIIIIGFNGRNIYLMNNTVVVDYQDLFIYLDFGYPYSYDDVTILCQLNCIGIKVNFFVHDDKYFKYL